VPERKFPYFRQGQPIQRRLNHLEADPQQPASETR
jgi:hypothetical protein